MKYFSVKTLKNWIKARKNDILLAAEVNKELAGFLLCSVSNTGSATIINLMVVKKFRSKSIAKMLLKECFKKLEKMKIFFVDA